MIWFWNAMLLILTTTCNQCTNWFLKLSAASSFEMLAWHHKTNVSIWDPETNVSDWDPVSSKMESRGIVDICTENYGCLVGRLVWPGQAWEPSEWLHFQWVAGFLITLSTPTSSTSAKCHMPYCLFCHIALWKVKKPKSQKGSTLLRSQFN